MKVGTVRGGHDLEAIRDAVNGWYVGVVALRQAGHSRFAALGAPQSFVPIIGHGRENKSTSLVCRFGRGRKLQERKSFPPPLRAPSACRCFSWNKPGPEMSRRGNAGRVVEPAAPPRLF